MRRKMQRATRRTRERDYLGVDQHGIADFIGRGGIWY